MEDDNNEKVSQEELDELDIIAKKEKEREIQRKEILNNAVSGKVANVRDRIALILNNFDSARNSDSALAWTYWKTFETDIFNSETLSYDQFSKLTKISSLSRIRAKIQNEYKLFQANPKVRKFRGVLEEEKRQEAIDDKPSYPFYTVFIDETGKTQQYISVGSLWITDSKTQFFGSFKLREWIKNKGISYEFHFAQVKGHKLNEYKDFFLKFLTLHPTCGFKVIIVNKNGISNVNQAITDLSFHLIHEGIKHEDNTNRAPLPRLLQVRIDDEEKGSDDLKLENVKERITSQQIEGLEIDSFEAIKSEDNFYIQAVDLFVSSINRKLHTPNGNKAKDKLADYILNLLDFQLNLFDPNNSKVDKSAVFNLSYKEKK